jgi:hypothetical protein
MGLTFEGKELADCYVTVALANLKFDDDKIKQITLELDKLMFECDVTKVLKKAKRITRRVFSDCF